MPSGEQDALTGRTYLTRVQYRTDVNLAARQAIYAYQQPRIDLAKTVLDLAGVSGAEAIADIGCGNGAYLAELARRDYAGRVVGVDLSAGMLSAASGRAPDAALLVGDAAALPMADDAVDVAMAMHMLYHVPDRLAAVQELRRITKNGGRALVVLNGADHLAELRDLILAATRDIGLSARDTWAEEYLLDYGAALLASVFGSVERHDIAAGLVVPDRAPVLDYIRSVFVAQALPDPEQLVNAAAKRLPAGEWRIKTHSGLLICR